MEERRLRVATLKKITQHLTQFQNRWDLQST